MIAGEPLEQMDAGAFDAVAADAPQRVVADGAKISGHGGRPEVAHGEISDVNTLTENSAVTRRREGGRQPMNPPRERAEMTGGLGEIRRLVKRPIAERQSLVETEDKGAGATLRNIERLCARELSSEIARFAAARQKGGLDRALIDLRRFDLQYQSHRLQRAQPRHARRSEHRWSAAPE